MRTLTLLALLVWAVSIPVSGQSLSKITAPVPAQGELFGDNLDIDGDYLVVGAPQNSEAAFLAGAIYFYERVGGQWQLQQKILGASAWDQLGGTAGTGSGLALSGERAVVQSATRAHVYRRTGGVWAEEAQLQTTSGVVFKVSMDGDRIAAADNYGLHIFDRSGTTWVQTDILKPSYTSWFAPNSVSVSGDRVAFGNIFEPIAPNVLAGAVYVFEKSGSSWSETRLVPQGLATEDWFGVDLEIDDDRLVVGAYGDDGLSPETGAAYVFDFDGTSWNESAKLTANDATITSNFGERFGWSVDVDADYIAVGAPFTDVFGLNSGTAYVFGFDGSDWIQNMKYVATEGSQVKIFAFDVALSGDVVAIGAPADNSAQVSAGAVYLAELDDDMDGVVNSVDYCPATAIPETPPTKGLNPNHWALLDGDFQFDTVAKGNSVKTSFSTADTAGCSCEQIAVEAGLSGSVAKKGCNTQVIEDWVDFISTAGKTSAFISSYSDDAPTAFELGNYPNPFNPVTTIRFALPESQHVRLDVFDMTGRRIALLAEGPREAGSHEVRFDGRGIPSGLYVYRLQTSDQLMTGHMFLLK